MTEKLLNLKDTFYLQSKLDFRVSKKTTCLQIIFISIFLTTLRKKTFSYLLFQSLNKELGEGNQSIIPKESLVHF